MNRMRIFEHLDGAPEVYVEPDPASGMVDSNASAIVANMLGARP